MNKTKLEEMAVTAFENVQSARNDLYLAAELTIACSAVLEDDKNSATVAGKFDGKNAEIREAQAREFLSAQYSDVSEAQRKERQARYKFDRAQIDVDAVKTLLRIAELAE